MTFTPNRRTVLRTAAWSVPAVTVATATPAFASSTLAPNLSASNKQLGTVSKQTASGNHVRVSAPQFVNTGTASATGIIMTVTSDVPITNYQLSVPFNPTSPLNPADYDITLSGVGTSTVTVAFGLPFFGYFLDAPVAPATQSQMTMFVNSLFYYSGAAPTKLDYTVKAANGGAMGGWSIPVPA